MYIVSKGHKTQNKQPTSPFYTQTTIRKKIKMKFQNPSLHFISYETHPKSDEQFDGPAKSNMRPQLLGSFGHNYNRIRSYQNKSWEMLKMSLLLRLRSD